MITKWFAIFKAGDYQDKGSWPVEFCREAVENFGKKKYECPAVLHHPPENDPTLGQVVDMEMRGDFVFCRLEPEPELLSLHKRGKINGVSARVNRNLNGNGPAIEHIGFLDKAQPAIKELAHVSFAEGDAERTDIDFDAPEHADFANVFMKEEAVDGGEAATASPSEETKPVGERIGMDELYEAASFTEGRPVTWLDMMNPHLMARAAKKAKEIRAAKGTGWTGAVKGGSERAEASSTFSGERGDVYYSEAEASRLYEAHGREVCKKHGVSREGFIKSAVKIKKYGSAANFSKGDSAMKKVVNGADFSEAGAADFYEKNSSVFSEVGITKEDFVRHRAAFSGSPELGRYLILAEKADFAEKVLAGYYEKNKDGLRSAWPTREDFIKGMKDTNTDRLIKELERPKQKSFREDFTVEKAEAYYKQHKDELGCTLKQWLKNAPNIRFDSNSSTNFAGEKKKPVRVDFTGDNAEEFYDANREDFERDGVTKEAWLKQAPYIRGVRK